MLRTLTTLILLLGFAPATLAEVTLPSVFGDHMVLQRDADVRIWGKAEPGETVSVGMAYDSMPNAKIAWAPSVQADKDGRWQVMLPKQQAGMGYRLTINGSKTDEPLVFKDVAIGEVWVASGQSNMSWTVAQSANAEQEIVDSGNAQIRMWTAARTVATEPAYDVAGSWAVASPETTGDFSAVAYYFARKIQSEVGVPVGILHASWGGTPVEAWTSRDKLEAIDWAAPILQRYDAAIKAHPKAKAEYDRAMKLWNERRNGPPNTGEKKGYAKLGYNDAKWKTMKLPQGWEKAGLNVDGVVWFRKTIEVPVDWAGQKLSLSLGPIDDGDTTYVNGKAIGQTEPSGRGNWQIHRRYDVPANLVEAGKLAIAVRVVDLTGEGGIWGKPEQLTLARADGKGESISIAGDWKYLVETELDAKNRPTRRPAPPYGPEHPHSPAGLFNGMLAPVVPYTIQGAIWYQGEHNAPRAQQYGKLFPGMIADWRERWGQGDFPFLFVQLANYRQPTDRVVDTDWAQLRHVQLQTLRRTNNAGMAVTIDIGEANDIHPRNKQDVGDRLARWALAETYDRDDVVMTGPLYQNVQPTKRGNQNAMLVDFLTYGSGLATRDQKPPQGFTIAAKDGKFFKASAELVEEDGRTTRRVRVWSDKVKQPVAVRYAWEDNPTEANLINDAGLPASPFRTDQFTGPTDGRR
jgi:sialate O-acetylesterase